MIEEVDRRLEALDHIVEERDIDFERIDRDTFRIEGEIVFINGFVLEFMEFSSPDNHDYRFQLMDKEKNMVKRWDSAPHHDVETFPYHVHVSENEVEASTEKDFVEILDLVEDIVTAET